VASRAFSSLRDFIALTRGRLDAGGVWLAMKGALPKVEIAALGTGLDVFHVEHLQVPGLAAERCLVWVRER
jgi:16S rRNA (guanine527-N7)-methyltransferase